MGEWDRYNGGGQLCVSGAGVDEWDRCWGVGPVWSMAGVGEWSRYKSVGPVWESGTGMWGMA